MFRKVATVMRGTVVAQAVGIAILPLLSRLYAPEAFGHLQLYQSAMTLLLVVAAMRYEIALLHAEDGRELAATLRLCLIVNVAVAGVTALVLLAAQATGLLPRILPFPAAAWLLPVGVLVGGILQTLLSLLTRREAYGRAAGGKMVQSAGYATAATGIGTVAPAGAGLIVADLLGRVAAIATIARGNALDGPRLRVRSGDVRAVAARFRHYPLFSVPGGLINAGGAVLTSIMMYAGFTAALSGQYGLVDRSIALPLGLIGYAVSQVYTAELARDIREGRPEAAARFRRIVGLMALLGIGPAIILGLGGPALFVFLFGDAWAVAGGFARVLAPMYLASFITGPVNMTLLVLERQGLQMIWEASRFVLIALGWIVVAHYHLAPGTALALYAAISVGAMVAFLLMADRLLRRDTAGKIA